MDALPNLLIGDNPDGKSKVAFLQALVPQAMLPMASKANYTRSGSLPHGPAVTSVLDEMLNEDSENEGAAQTTGVLGVRRAGECFGELALLYHAPGTSTAVAVEDSVVWSVSQAQFRRIMRSVGQDKIDKIVQKLGHVDLLQGLLS